MSDISIIEKKNWFQAFEEHDPYSMIARLELLLETSSQVGTGRRNSEDGHSQAGSHSGETVTSQVSSALQSTPQVSSISSFSVYITFM